MYGFETNGYLLAEVFVKNVKITRQTASFTATSDESVKINAQS